MRHFAANAMTLLIIAVVALTGVVYYGKSTFERAGPNAEPLTIVLPRGAALNGIADQLKAAGAISDATIFRLGARYRSQTTKLRFGEYEIPARASMAEIMDILSAGKTIKHKLTIAEGLTSHEIIAQIIDAEILDGAPGEIPPEGALAPDTYFLERGDSRAGVVKRMTDEQSAILAKLWGQRAKGLPLDTPREALILASIVEKETGLPEERPLVASVFINRLSKGMKLQSDPTIIYGLTLGGGALDRPLTRADINKSTPYNTYVIAGLPPTPIANPGRDSIAAVLNPAQSDYLYFVASGDGGHHFARTLREHNANVAAWRKVEKQRAAN